jgi:hypothetical protein
MIIVKRKEIEDLVDIQKWLLIFGRRKTGKTFLVRNYLKYDEYFFVKRNKEIMVGRSSMNYDTFIEVFSRMLDEGKTTVVDEFHRLGDDFQDYLHYSSSKKGRVIAVSSTLNLSKKLVSSHSPLLGLFAEYPIQIINLHDVLLELKKQKFSKKELVEMAILLREPLAIKYHPENKKPLEIYTQIMRTSKLLVPALVGEIFREEQRSLSAIYEGILRSVALGKQISSEISDFLFSSKLIDKNDPSMIQQYLGNLVSFGLLKKLNVHNKKHFYYKHASPLIYAYYYGDEKYNFSELSIDKQVIKDMLKVLYPKIVEDNIREFLANHFGLAESTIVEKDYDIDVCLLKFKKPEIIAEIKWKKKIDSEDIKKAEKSLSKIKAKRKILFVPDKKEVKIKTELEIMDITDFI